METSRVFVQGLPPSLSSEDFQKHFSKVFPTTDAKLFPHRRIGYVGYSSHDEACKAVKYFNKSYILMSRIRVELAKPTASVSARNTSDQEHAAATQSMSSQGSVPRQKRKYDAVDGKGNSASALLVTRKDNENHSPGKFSNVKGVHDSKRQRKPQDEASNTLVADLDAQGPKDRVDEVDASQDTLAVSDKGQEANSNTTDGVENPPASDADWLRSRTSRLLGLLNDDEVQGPTVEPTIRQDEHSSDGDSDDAEEDIKDPGTVAQVERKVSRTEDIQPDNTTSEDAGPRYTRLFIRNLAYNITESDLREQFEKYGPLDEVSIPRDFRSNQSKGIAFVSFFDHDNAQTAMTALDGQAFHGRLLHIMPSPEKKTHTQDDYQISQLPLKKQKQIRRKTQAPSSSIEWNSLYMHPDAVMSSVSDRLGISKSELLDPTSSSSAVQTAIAETSIILETKSYLKSQGVNMSFKAQRTDSVILVKNFPFETQVNELKEIFEPFGNLKRVILPPPNTIAIVEFESPASGKLAFKALAYRKFKDSVLYLEKGPRGLFEPSAAPGGSLSGNTTNFKPSTTDLLTPGGPTDDGGSSQTLFVKNLNFSTTTEKLREVFEPLDGFVSAQVKRKQNSKIPGEMLSMGYGFLEFRSQTQANTAMAAMNGFELDGHSLLITASHRGADSAEMRRKIDDAKKVASRRTKIIIKNLPFEASPKDVRSLFSSYGKLRSVRVPKRFDNSTRGFAFAEFISANEAESAMDALSNTHLLGRRLVLEFAAEDSIDPEEEIEKMQKKTGKQADKAAIQRLKGNGRRKFNVEERDEDQF